VLDATPDGIRVVDPEGRLLLANPAMDRLLASAGWGSAVENPYEAATRFAGRTSDPECFTGALEALRADPTRVAEDEYRLAGSEREFVRYSAPVHGGADAEGIIGRIFVHREVTEERRAERAKDEFIALASHELRTPLTSILGYTEALREDDSEELALRQLRWLDVIDRNGRRLMRLVDDLLVVARGDAGRLALSPEWLDLAELAREGVLAARPAARDQAIALVEELPPEGLWISGDRARLGQVLDNLISNALKFTPVGGQVRVSARTDGDEAVLEVADTGIGIAHADQTRLFERFYRTAQAAGTPGTGLGLAISRMIVEAHDGGIKVESEEGAGAVFSVRLPIRAGTPHRPQHAEDAEAVAGT
jgi:signal transduction histidine kinase